MKANGQQISIAGDGKFDSPGEDILLLLSLLHLPLVVLDIVPNKLDLIVQFVYIMPIFRLDCQEPYLHTAVARYKEDNWGLGG